MRFACNIIATTALIALFGLVTAQLPTKCTEQTYGRKDGTEVKLVDQPMPAGVRDPPVPAITSNDCPKHSAHLGSKIRACDFDVAPYVLMTNLNKGEVHRNEDLVRPGQMYISLYCVE